MSLPAPPVIVSTAVLVVMVAPVALDLAANPDVPNKVKFSTLAASVYPDKDVLTVSLPPPVASVMMSVMLFTI